MSQSVAFLVIHFLKNERKSSSDEQTNNSNTQEEVGIELQAGLHSVRSMSPVGTSHHGKAWRLKFSSRILAQHGLQHSQEKTHENVYKECQS